MNLQAKDLRVGNLVKYDNRVFEIDSICKDFPTLNTIEFGAGVVDWNNLTPIPLTEKWLKDFGEYPYKLSVGQIRLRNGKYFFKYHSIEVELPYVHTLQNLFFALTNQELELKTKP